MTTVEKYDDVINLLQELGLKLDFEDAEIRMCSCRNNMKIVKAFNDAVTIKFVFYANKLQFVHCDKVCIVCSYVNDYLYLPAQEKTKITVIECLDENSKKVAEVYLE